MKKTTILFLLVATFFLSACEQEAGPMEKAGKKIDETAQNASDSMGQALENLGDAVEDTADKAD